ncbi:MAG TPA: type I DNA topoisomerase [Vicinamibacterales bacterium]|jgi:DNA topoisomerase-1|nr:type I DNA topoisomerase [Vicinamibacterales bacterium]
MAKALVVVESPAKAKTINKYLGRDFKVIASMGHVRDLPKSKLGVDIEAGFRPEYVVLPDRQKVIKELKDAAKAADQVFVATDPDREGEAIGWHLAEELGGTKKKIRRLMFNEITKKAILEAMNHPGDIDMRMVDAQQARRVLDRLVGYKISPILWDKVRRGLSAGRVQSVALKLVCDREREIEAFVAEEFWHITARLAGAEPPEFDARLMRKGDAAVKVSREAEAKAILDDLSRASFVVSSVATKERRRHAVPPFITSKLQQASRFPVKKTMMVAQQLYEGIQLPDEDAPIGLITYMRTDSVRVAEQALDEVRAHVRSAFGEAYVPEQPNRYKVKSNAQDAHEAIRPTSMRHTPESVRAYLTPDQFSLYRLIWNRFVASQMTAAVFDDTTVDISAGEYVFRAKGSVPRFAGWLAVYQGTGEAEESERTERPAAKAAGADADEETTSGVLPALSEGQALDVRAITPEQKFTQPPPRYNEGSLVKALEENGIGRPSTYASIIGVLQARDYVNKVEGRFRPTILGRRLVDRLLHPVFDDILDVEYTARMEDQLDNIEKGKADYQDTLSSFYKSFQKDLTRAAKEMPNFKEGQPTGITCDKCGQGEMVEKAGKFGIFLACSRYPDCDNTKELEPAEAPAEDLEETCENCGRPMVLKRGRFGMFLACTGYPECKTTRKIISTKQGMAAAKPDQILDEKCPNCGRNLVLKQGRFGEFTACTGYPECKYVKQKSTGVACPKDGGDIVERKSRRGKVFYGCANYPKCDFTLWNKPVPEPCPKCGWAFLTEKITKRHGRQLICANEACDYVRSADLEPAATEA